jgi:predicted porin
MKKKAVALAVGALFAAPAVQAQLTMGNETTGTVQVYGKLYPQYGWGTSSGATAPGTGGVSTLVGGIGDVLPASNVAATNAAGSNSTTNVALGQSGGNPAARNSVDSQNSYVGFRGERKLVGAWKGIWQVEQSIALDTGTGTWSNRNTFAGLSHGQFGTVKLGNMDTIYKEYGDTFSMFGIASGNFISASNVLSHIGIGNNNVARFHERRPNSIMYQTSEFAGFQAGVMYGPDETKGNLGQGLNANLWSYGVKWDSQMFYASVHREVHNDNFGASNNIPVASLRNGTTDNRTGAFTPDAGAHSTDSATRASGEVRFSGPFASRIVVDVARLKYTERGATTVTGPRFESYTKTNWGVGYDAGIGAWRFATQYLRGGSGSCILTAGANCSTAGLASWMWTLGARYRLDRQTFVYVIGAKLSNGPSARYDNWSATDPERGGDVKQAAVGLSYSF